MTDEFDEDRALSLLANEVRVEIVATVGAALSRPIIFAENETAAPAD
ncbi:hypothetical protein [Haloarchaeobius baliensis]